MMRFQTTAKRIILGSGLIGLAVSAAAMASDVYVIAHSSVELSQSEIKAVFKGEQQFAGLIKLVPVDNTAVQSDFLDKALDMEASRYGAMWIKKSFRGGLAAPETKSGDAEVIYFVNRTPGAVGYLSAPAAGAKVLYKY